jgi:hypothetical protein
MTTNPKHFDESDSILLPPENYSIRRMLYFKPKNLNALAELAGNI